MDKQIFDVSKLTLDQSGRIIIDDEKLTELEQTLIKSAGGGVVCPEEPCDWSGKTNQFSCNGTSNQAGCDNGLSCDHSTNNDCVNALSCGGSKNTKKCGT